MTWKYLALVPLALIGCATQNTEREVLSEPDHVSQELIDAMNVYHQDQTYENLQNILISAEDIEDSFFAEPIARYKATVWRIDHAEEFAQTMGQYLKNEEFVFALHPNLLLPYERSGHIVAKESQEFNENTIDFISKRQDYIYEIALSLTNELSDEELNTKLDSLETVLEEYYQFRYEKPQAHEQILTKVASIRDEEDRGEVEVLQTMILNEHFINGTTTQTPSQDKYAFGFHIHPNIDELGPYLPSLTDLMQIDCSAVFSGTQGVEDCQYVLFTYIYSNGEVHTVYKSDYEVNSGELNVLSIEDITKKDFEWYYPKIRTTEQLEFMKECYEVMQKVEHLLSE